MISKRHATNDFAAPDDTPPPWVDFYLLGEVPYEQFLALQRRLVYELGGESRRRILVLICEHEPLITIGRAGSRGHVNMTGEQLRHRQLDVRWVARGGGCILHGPGQLAIYPLVPLELLGWNVGCLLRSVQEGLRSALQSLAILARLGDSDFGLWGKSGQLAAPGVAVRHGVSHYGWYLNVNPTMGNYRFIATPHPCRRGNPEVADGTHQLPEHQLTSKQRTEAERSANTKSGVPLPFAGTARPSAASAANRQNTANLQKTMGCLVAERSQGIKMTEVRGAVVEHLTAALGADHYNIFSRHPHLSIARPHGRKPHTRAS